MRINPFKAKKKLSNNFLLVQSLINFPIHYQPKKFSQDPNDNNKYILMNSFPNILDKNSFKPKQEMHGSLSQYAIKKNKNRISIIKKLQREKIDILLNNVMDKANYNIRDYNYKNANKEIKITPLPNLTREARDAIKTDIINKYQSFSNKKKNFDSPIKKKYDLWTKKILDERKIKIYRKFYSLKYLKIDDKMKFKIQFLKNSKNIINNIVEENKKKNKYKTFYNKNYKKFYSPQK
jgi:hypothetical protein